MKVIFGVDGSAGSNAAVQFAARLLSPTQDEVLLFYSPPTIHLKLAAPLEPKLAERVQQMLNRAVFDEARRNLPAHMQDGVLEIVGTQKPAHGILVAADEYRADMIVVGARGSGSLKEPTVGSVARALAHHATIPLLVVRSSASADVARPLRVLMASDGSPSSRHASQIVGKLCWPAESIGRVLTVVEPLMEGQIPRWLQDRLFQEEVEAIGLGHFEPTSDEQHEVMEHLTRWCGELPANFQGHLPLVIVGQARPEIVKAIETEEADLVVVGARGINAVGRLLLGSTSEHLLMHAPCSILIARQHEKA